MNKIAWSCRKALHNALAGPLVVGSLLALGTTAFAQGTTAVEYHYAEWDHYFLTAAPDEIAALDGGAFNGNWKRTGESFAVGAQPTGNLSATCRFFSTSFAPRSSHFYTPFAAECGNVKASADWQYEGIAFYLQLASPAGVCPSGAAPLYRLYNNGVDGAPNHRYTTSRATVATMRAQGWTPEGNGPDATFACLPVPAAVSPATGVWKGSTGFGEAVTMIVLEDGAYYIVINTLATSSSGRVIQGIANAANGVFTSSGATVYPIAATGEGDTAAFPEMVAGTYTPRGTLQLSTSDYRGDDAVSATYVAGSDQPASAAAAAGSYSGFTGHTGGRRNSTFTMNADGTIAGNTPSAGCMYRGIITPRASVNAFDWTWTEVPGSSCFISSLSGMLYYDAAARRVYGLAPFGAGQDLWLMIGAKP